MLTSITLPCHSLIKPCDATKSQFLLLSKWIVQVQTETIRTAENARAVATITVILILHCLVDMNIYFWLLIQYFETVTSQLL